MEVLQHVTAAMDRGLQQLHRKEETAKRAPPHFPPAAAEMEGLMADLQQELEFVRQEKVWKAFNLQEAESNYQTISGKYPACFAVTVGWYKMEVHVLNWILSPSHQLLRGIVAMCDSLQRKASQFLKEVKQLGDAEVYLVYGLECRILRAELQMMQAFADFMKKNAMAAAHTLLGVYNHCKDTAAALQDCEDKVALKDQFTRYCESSTSLTQLLDTDHISPELLASLAGMIEAKTLDIRRMHLDRRAEVSEEVLNATRDLLRLKQLYRDLSGKWKSSDGHHDTSNTAEEPSPPHPPTAAVLNESVLTTPVKQQCSRPFPISLTTPEKLSFSDGLDDMDKENEGAQSPVAAESPRAKRVQLPITVITPKKQSLPTIKMVLPRLSDLTKLWEAAPALDVPIKPRHRGSGARKSSIKTNSTVHTTTSNSSASNSSHSFFEDAVGIQEAWQRAGHCFLLRATASLRARLEMINALFNIGVATVPDSLSWVLAILNVSASSASGLSSLFALHRVEQSRWSAAATLLLMSMPMEIVERAFDEPHGPGVALPGNCAARFHAVIEAQALMLPWTASHPLWLASLARSTHHYSEINANLHTKLDHLRRALRSERYLLRGKAAQQTEECFFWIRFDMVKQFMGIGHWMQAISASRDLLSSLRDDSILKRFGTISLIAATAALVNAEEFVTQTKYMQLKFDDRIILNGGSNGKNQASMTRKARTASFSSAQNLSADRNRHLLHIVTRAFTHVKGSISTSVGDSACLRMFLGVSYVSNTSTYNSRTAQYMQTHELLERMHAEDFDQHSAADIVMEEFLLHWCFLLPLEMVYLFQRSEGNDHEAAHAQLLQIADKGALLFAEKYLLGNEKRCYQQWGELTLAVVLQDLVNREAATLKIALGQPSSKLRIRYEHVVLTGSKQLRLDVAPPASTDTINDMAATLLWGPVNAAVDNSETLRRVRIHCHKLAQALKAKEDRPAAAGYSLPSRPEKLAADMLVAWLLLRGRALQHMGRVWEALLMFKLLLTLQAIAPRSSWAPFVAHYHIAEIITNYEVCELNPHKMAAEHLELACVSMQESLTSTTNYASEYLASIQELAASLSVSK